MKAITLSVLLGAAVVLALPATAQDSPTPPAAEAPSTFNAPLANSAPDSGWNGDDWRHFPDTDVSQLYRGVRALKSGNFELAETTLTRALKSDADDGLANFYMGVAQMGLGKWDAARVYLEIAYREDMTHPDPASRLGVAYAMLGNTAGAQAQRAALVAMADECKSNCRLAPFIIGGIRMIDDALVGAAIRKPASGMAVYAR